MDFFFTKNSQGVSIVKLMASNIAMHTNRDPTSVMAGMGGSVILPYDQCLLIKVSSAKYNINIARGPNRQSICKIITIGMQQSRHFVFCSLTLLPLLQVRSTNVIMATAKADRPNVVAALSRPSNR